MSAFESVNWRDGNKGIRQTRPRDLRMGNKPLLRERVFGEIKELSQSRMEKG